MAPETEVLHWQAKQHFASFILGIYRKPTSPVHPHIASRYKPRLRQLQSSRLAK